jgi:hypothetical protein
MFNHLRQFYKKLWLFIQKVVRIDSPLSPPGLRYCTKIGYNAANKTLYSFSFSLWGAILTFLYPSKHWKIGIVVGYCAWLLGASVNLSSHSGRCLCPSSGPRYTSRGWTWSRASQQHSPPAACLVGPGSWSSAYLATLSLPQVDNTSHLQPAWWCQEADPRPTWQPCLCHR